MITAIDTNVLLDILIPDEIYFPASKKLLDEYVKKGQLIIGEIVYSELASQFPSEKQLRAFLLDTGIRLIHSTERALWLAGERWEHYIRNKKQALQCTKCGKEMIVNCPGCDFSINFRQRILSDFIIGAHALSQAELLLTRDRGFYKTYFKDLRIG